MSKLSNRQKKIARDIINYFQEKKDIINLMDIKEDFFDKFHEILENNKIKKKYDDPSYVKKPKSSFIYFIKDEKIKERIKIKEEYEEDSDEESIGILIKPKKNFIKKMSDIWNSKLVKNYCVNGKFIENATKRRYDFTEFGNKYNLLYLEDKERYNRDIESKGIKKLEKIKSNKPRNVYNIFREYTVKKIKSSNPSVSYYEIIYLLYRSWENMKDRTKFGPYRDKDGTYDFFPFMKKFICHSNREKEEGIRIEFDEEYYNYIL